MMEDGVKKMKRDLLVMILEKQKEGREEEKRVELRKKDLERFLIELLRFMIDSEEFPVMISIQIARSFEMMVAQ